jgi:hypothetical protein|tara:strand:+ start:295 stop:459 length:165 start_codon:yes stop_codon:yes gene_type:complete
MTDQQLIDQAAHIMSEDIHITDKEVARILEISEDKMKSLMKIMVANAPKDTSPF